VRSAPRWRLTLDAAWLNEVERWFALLTDEKLRRAAHRSIQAMEKDIRDWIKT
jgi:hypothetical protein